MRVGRSDGLHLRAQVPVRGGHAQIHQADHIGRGLPASHWHTAPRSEDRESTARQEFEHQANRLRAVELHEKRAVHHPVRLSGLCW